MTKIELIEENNRLETEVAYLKGLLETPIKTPNKEIKFGTKTFKYVSDMIKAAQSSGYVHSGGKNLHCLNCGQMSVRKFNKDEKTVHCCHKCAAVY